MQAPLPPGFASRMGERSVVVARLDLVPALEALGLLGGDALERALGAGVALEGGRGTVRQVTLPGRAERLLVRRLLHGGWLAPLLADHYAGLSRPLRELGVASRLRAAGAPVPAPAALFARRGALPTWRIAVASGFEEGTLDALRLLREAPTRDRMLRAAAALGDAVRRFHDAGGRHPDLHLGNLLVREDADGWQGLVVDMDRVRIAAPTTRSRMAELMRLYRSLRKRGVMDQVGPRGCARFFGAYCRGDRQLRRALLERLAAERRRVAFHAWRFRESSA